MRWVEAPSTTSAPDRIEAGFQLQRVRGHQVATIIIEVMPKRELLDPAGKAVHRSLLRDGNDCFTDVRIGKRFELSVDGAVTDAHLDTARVIAEELLSNGVIEDVVDIRVEDKN
jgi:phosphoribosylformylglycinamidine (FGAM) synthase PurS component